MPTFAEMMPRRFFSAESFKSMPRTLTIKSFAKENVNGEGKPEKKCLVLRFEDTDEGCVLNNERVQALTDIFGENSADCIGKKVKLYQGKTKFGGKAVPCVSIGKAE